MLGPTPHTTQTNSHSPAVLQAKQALAKANAEVDADKAAHSPSCVAVDEKQVERAQAQLAEVSATPSSGTQALSITV